MDSKSNFPFERRIFMLLRTIRSRYNASNLEYQGQFYASRLGLGMLLKHYLVLLLLGVVEALTILTIYTKIA